MLTWKSVNIYIVFTVNYYLFWEHLPSIFPYLIPVIIENNHNTQETI